MQNDGNGNITLPAPIKINYSTLPTLTTSHIGYTWSNNFNQLTKGSPVGEGIKISSSSNLTNLSSLVLPAGVFILTAGFSVQSSAAVRGNITQILSCFSDSATAYSQSTTTAYFQKNCWNDVGGIAATSRGWDYGIIRDTISQTIVLPNGGTVYFNVAFVFTGDTQLNINEGSNTTINCKNCNFTATRIA
jgi:hypothetical protein